MEVILRKPPEHRIKIEALHLEDDDIDARIVKIVAGMTEDLELQITWVRNVGEARTAITGRHFDLYILDFRLKNETASEIVAILGRRGQSAIVLSNISDQEARSVRLGAGHVHFLSKGDCSPNSFNAAVRAVFDRRDPAALRNPSSRDGVA